MEGTWKLGQSLYLSGWGMWKEVFECWENITLTFSTNSRTFPSRHQGTLQFWWQTSNSSCSCSLSGWWIPPPTAYLQRKDAMSPPLLSSLWERTGSFLPGKKSKTDQTLLSVGSGQLASSVLLHPFETKLCNYVLIMFSFVKLSTHHVQFCKN